MSIQLKSKQHKCDLCGDWARNTIFNPIRSRINFPNVNDKSRILHWELRAHEQRHTLHFRLTHTDSENSNTVWGAMHATVVFLFSLHARVPSLQTWCCIRDVWQSFMTLRSTARQAHVIQVLTALESVFSEVDNWYNGDLASVTPWIVASLNYNGICS
jgi:hypothetical protein